MVGLALSAAAPEMTVWPVLAINKPANIGSGC